MPDGAPVVTLTAMTAAPPAAAIQSSAVVRYRRASRHPAPVKKAATAAPVASIPTSLALPLRVVVVAWCSSSTAAHATATTNATHVAPRRVRRVVRVSAPNHNVARMPYSVMCADFRISQCRPSIMCADAHGNNASSKGRTTLAVA